MLAQLRRVVSFDAASIHLADPPRRSLLRLASTGYDREIQDHMRSSLFVDDVETVGLDRPRPPLRWLNALARNIRLRTWTDFLRPVGLAAGVWMGLFRPDESQLGLLTMHTGPAREASADACELLGLLAPAIGSAVDPLRSAIAVAQTVTGALAGVIITMHDRAVTLPGLPRHRVIGDGSAVLTAVSRELGDGQQRVSFVCPHGTDGRHEIPADHGGGLRRGAPVPAAAKGRDSPRPASCLD